VKFFFIVLRNYISILSGTLKRVAKINSLEKTGNLNKDILHSTMKEWGIWLCKLFKIELHIVGVPSQENGVLFLGNHISYLDIPILMSVAPVAFVAKNEVSNWPVFGAACRRVGTVFVKRGQGGSRKNAANTIAQKIISEKQSVVIFPSGTTTLDEKKPWKRGPFYIAMEANVPVQPFRIRYTPAREVAYIDDDFFPTHLWRLLSVKEPIKAYLEFGRLLKFQTRN
jgi:1-acyl-sn-glycerol-3-phosphate acyltransferase